MPWILVRTYVSGEYVTSIFRVEECGKWEKNGIIVGKWRIWSTALHKPIGGWWKLGEQSAEWWPIKLHDVTNQLMAVFTNHCHEDTKSYTVICWIPGNCYFTRNIPWFSDLSSMDVWVTACFSSMSLRYWVILSNSNNTYTNYMKSHLNKNIMMPILTDHLWKYI